MIIICTEDGTIIIIRDIILRFTDPITDTDLIIPGCIGVMTSFGDSDFPAATTTATITVIGTDFMTAITETIGDTEAIITTAIMIIILIMAADMQAISMDTVIVTEQVRVKEEAAQEIIR